MLHEAITVNPMKDPRSPFGGLLTPSLPPPEMKRRHSDSIHTFGASVREVELERLLVQAELSGRPVPVAVLRQEARKGLASSSIRKKV